MQLARTAEAAGRLIGQGLTDRGLSGFSLTDETGVLNPAIAPLAYAYEAALLAGLSPEEVRTLRRLLTRVEAAALKLSGRWGLKALGTPVVVAFPVLIAAPGEPLA